MRYLLCLVVWAEILVLKSTDRGGWSAASVSDLDSGDR